MKFWSKGYKSLKRNIELFIVG